MPSPGQALPHLTLLPSGSSGTCPASLPACAALLRGHSTLLVMLGSMVCPFAHTHKCDAADHQVQSL